MARYGMAKFLITVMFLLILKAVSEQDRGSDFQHAEQHYCSQLAGGIVVTDTCTPPSGAEGATPDNSIQRELERVLAERNIQLQDEVARKNKEINKLLARNQILLQDFCKLQVDCPKEIIHCVSTKDKQQTPATPNPNKAGKKRSREESSISLSQDNKYESSNEQQAPATANPNRAGKKRPREESSISLAQDNKYGSSSDDAPERKKKKVDHHLYQTLANDRDYD